MRATEDYLFEEIRGVTENALRGKEKVELKNYYIYKESYKACIFSSL